MAKLSEMYKRIGEYLAANGDKEVTSIATWSGDSETEYTLRLHDIGSGVQGPYTGRDVINVPRN